MRPSGSCLLVGDESCGLDTFCWIPFIGWIFSLYRLYLATVGIREMYATTTGRALVVLPAILILVLVVVVAGASAIVFFRAA